MLVAGDIWNIPSVNVQYAAKFLVAVAVLVGPPVMVDVVLRIVSTPTMEDARARATAKQVKENNISVKLRLGGYRNVIVV